MDTLLQQTETMIRHYQEICDLYAGMIQEQRDRALFNRSETGQLKHMLSCQEVINDTNRLLHKAFAEKDYKEVRHLVGCASYDVSQIDYGAPGDKPYKNLDDFKARLSSMSSEARRLRYDWTEEFEKTPDLYPPHTPPG